MGEEEEAALESEGEDEEKGEGKAGDVLLDDAMVQRWLSNYREPTRSEYLKVFRRYFRWLRYKRKIPTGAKPTDLIKDHLKCLYSTPYDDLESKLKHTNWLLEYVDYLRKKGLSMWTVSHAVKIRSFYAFSAAPLQKFRVPTDPEIALRRVSRQVIPSVREWLTLIPHLSEWGRSLTYFLMYTGLRLNEALLLTMDNLNPERDEKATALYRRGVLIVDMVNKKGRSEAPYFTFIAGKGLTMLLNYVKANKARIRAEGGKIWPYTSKTYQHNLVEAAVKANLVNPPRNRGKGWRQPYHAHALRHLFSTEADMAGVPRHVTEFFMGHEQGISSIQATYKHPRMYPENFAREYLKLSNRLDSLHEGKATEIQLEA